MLIVENLSVQAGRNGPAVLNGVNLSVGQGEIVGVVGESGAGKSVTGAAVTGLLSPPLRQVGGAIHFDGQRIDQLPKRTMRRLRGAAIATIFQDPLTALNPVFSVGRQLTETIQEHRGGTRAAARVRAIELLEACGIPAAAERLDSYPHAFSGGMRQRVVIALALAGDPRLIIADEPTTALDVSIQAQVLTLLRQLTSDMGVGIMLITHDMGVVAEVADRVAVLYAGRVAEQGPVREVLVNPRHPYTRALMGAIPEIGAGLARLPQISGAMPRAGQAGPGCAFAPRCAARIDICENTRPEPQECAEDVLVACHLAAPRATPSTGAA